MRPAAALVGVALVLGSWCACGGRAEAHAREPAVTVTLTASGAQVEIDYGVPAGPEARMLREQFDADHDGRLADAERAALTRLLERRSLAHVRFSAAGRPLEAQVTKVLVDAGGGFDTAIAARVWAALAPLGPGATWREVPTLVLEVGGARLGFAVRASGVGPGAPSVTPTRAQAVPGTPTVLSVQAASAPPSPTARPRRRAR